MRATKVPLGPWAEMHMDRRCRHVNLAAGECGVKDQVSRTQPNSNSNRYDVLRGPRDR